MSSGDTLPEPLANYFQALAEDDLEGVVEQFTADGIYYHPPNFKDEISIQGHDELRTYFVENRGAKAIEHDVQKVVTDGDSCGLVGRLTGDDIDGEDYFISFAELEEGKISYYIAGLLMGNV